MPRHIAIQPGQLYPQPDYSVAVDREGTGTAVMPVCEVAHEPLGECRQRMPGG